MKFAATFLKTLFQLLLGWIMLTFIFKFLISPAEQPTLGIPPFFSGELLIFTSFLKYILTKIFILALLLIILQIIALVTGKRGKTT